MSKTSKTCSCAKPMNLKGEKLEACGLEGIKGSTVKPPGVDLNFDT